MLLLLFKCVLYLGKDCRNSGTCHFLSVVALECSSGYRISGYECTYTQLSLAYPVHSYLELAAIRMPYRIQQSNLVMRLSGVSINIQMASRNHQNYLEQFSYNRAAVVHSTVVYKYVK